MKPELEDALITKYPDQFKNLKYIQCGDGWYDIIDRLCYIVQNRLDYLQKTDKPINFYWSQIKEKFGSLRCYCYDADLYIRGAIEMAQSISCITCEVSGDRGKLRYKKKDKNGQLISAWVRVLSDKLAIEEGYVDVGSDAEEND